MNFAVAVPVSISSSCCRAKGSGGEAGRTHYRALAGDHAVSVTTLAELAAKRVPLDPELTAILRRAGIGPSAGIVEIKRKLNSSYTMEWVRSCAYRRIATLCRENGIIPVFMYIPRLESDEYRPAFARCPLTREPGSAHPGSSWRIRWSAPGRAYVSSP